MSFRARKFHSAMSGEDKSNAALGSQEWLASTGASEYPVDASYRNAKGCRTVDEVAVELDVVPCVAPALHRRVRLRAARQASKNSHHLAGFERLLYTAQNGE